jgi:hypothetical protein
MAEQLSRAGPDLLRAMLAGAWLGDADAVCGARTDFVDAYLS